ncbi:hypothetical protein MAR_ORF225 [Marseillevirus marseillevirus]|uniref:Uncharacterized protein n=2 Tax=Marseillevirus TaxID=1513458 RepID=D2XAM6_GBMV|nr:hypothetical protein MAR_ORF225 [Marseillevirus marseillevirus]ADB04003.1 hypothetical protein MAR_ORF225 [Marseillevirus marseillevirus]
MTMNKIFIVENSSTHADVRLPNENIPRIFATATFSGFKGKRKICVVVTVEGVPCPWRSPLMEVKLSKKETQWIGEISPKDFFEGRGGIAPHVCIRLVDTEGKQLKSAGEWSMSLEF